MTPLATAGVWTAEDRSDRALGQRPEHHQQTVTNQVSERVTDMDS